jgi:LPXTG-site transpeptidase (sortase) family protein
MKRNRPINIFLNALALTALIFAALPARFVHAATFVVDRTDDNAAASACTAAANDCSLRGAITAANANAGGDIITLPAGTYQLTLAGAGENLNATGDLDINDSAAGSLTISGAGASTTIIQQTTGDRAIDAIGGDFTITGVTITGGAINGNNGGGINYNAGGILIVDSAIISNNSAANNLGGGGIYVGSGTANISKSTFTANSTANADGGGGIMFRLDGGSVFGTVTDSTFTGNSASGTFGAGGAINASSDSVQITGSIFSNNSATGVGDGDGGAVAIYLATSVIANSTFTGNRADRDGGAIFYRNDSTLDMTNVTIASNTADNNNNGTGDGGGFYTFNFGGSGAVVGNTIIAGNTDSGGQAPDCGGFDISSIGHNLIQNTTGCTITNILTGNITGQNPLLAALGNNGGPTQTRALQSGSPAIDAGDNVLCAGKPINNLDQRGVTRPQGAACDIGAWEGAGLLTVVSTSLPASVTAPGPSSFTVTFSKAASDPAGNSNIDDVTNPANYLIVNKGTNGVVDTVSCLGGVVADDLQVGVSSVSYNATNFTSIVVLSSALPAGSYRLFVCGTTSILDLGFAPLAGNGVTSGTDFPLDFVVNASSSSSSSNSTTNRFRLPSTGFAPSRVTPLKEQPAELAYTKLGDIWLEIPKLNVKQNIVGVPQTSKGWDTTWLGNDLGWLNGTAFPSWEGNSVLTGHVYNANGQPGPFVNIKDLKYGDQIIVHISGEKYIFEVRKTKLVRPETTSFALEHLEGSSYLTLITCQGYNEKSSSYRFRRVVRAVLVKVEVDK